MEIKARNGVAGIITTGRIGFADTFRSIFEAQFKVPYTEVPLIGISHTTGALWEIALTKAIYDIRDHEPEYYLFIDGDGIFDERDVKDLWNVIKSDDSIDAVFPVQADRNGIKPLAYSWLKEAGYPYTYERPVTPAIHGHFGLTFVRSRVFDELAEPWFWSMPGKSGKWTVEDGKRDADTYFWIKLHEHHAQLRDRFGETRRVIQPNQVVIGHMEQHIRWQVGPKVVVQTLSEYQRYGKPMGLRNPYINEMDAQLSARQNSKVADRMVALSSLSDEGLALLAEKRNIPVDGSREQLIQHIAHLDEGVEENVNAYKRALESYKNRIKRISTRFIGMTDGAIRLLAEKRGLNCDRDRLAIVTDLIKMTAGDEPRFEQELTD